MNYKLKVSNRFKKELKKLDKEDVHKIKEALDNLLKDPFATNDDIIAIVDMFLGCLYQFSPIMQLMSKLLFSQYWTVSGNQ